MATCRECLHFETCLNDKQQTRYYGEKDACNNVEDLCRYFLPKSDYVKRERGEWISVKDRLPEESCECLVATNIGGVFLVNYSHKHKTFNSTDEMYGDKFAMHTVTHWQPLPEPPKGE